jgi:hypothetical protein
MGLGERGDDVPPGVPCLWPAADEEEGRSGPAPHDIKDDAADIDPFLAEYLPEARRHRDIFGHIFPFAWVGS